jgi:glyoxylase-like metal-dependent hydrolase (beta-lactamase superfamily II)
MKKGNGSRIFDLVNPIIIYTILLILFLHGLYAQVPESKHFTLERLTEGVYAAIHSMGGYAICNAGIVDMGEELLIFDTFLSPQAASELKEFAEKLTSNSLRYVVNSHSHNDHIRGNQVFKPAATIISTSLSRTAMEKSEPQQIEQEKQYAPKSLKEFKAKLDQAKDNRLQQELKMWLGYYEAMVESHQILKTTLPDITFEKEFVLYGRERTLKLMAFEAGHTMGDLVMYLPDDKIIFTGDLVFIDMHPFLADGQPEENVSVLKSLMSLEIEKVVPGHGPVGNMSDIENMIRYIEVADSLARSFLAQGGTINHLHNIPIPPVYEPWWFPNFFRINMKFLFGRAVEAKQY